MAKASKTAARRTESRKPVSDTPNRSFHWGLADGLGLTLAVALTFSWPTDIDRGSVNAAILTVGALACLPFGLARWRAQPPRGLTWGPLVAAGVLLSWGVVSMLGSGTSWGTAVFGWFGRSDGLLTLAAVVALLVSAATLTSREADRLVTWLLAAGAIVVLETLAQVAGSPYPSNEIYGGASAALGNPNFLAATAAILGVLALGRALETQRRPWERAAALLLLLGLVGAAFLSDSLQGPVALVLGIVSGGMAWTLQHRGRGRAIGLGVSAMAIAAGLGVFVLMLMNSGPLRVVRDPVVLGPREGFWQTGWAMMLDRPLFGAGPDSLSRLLGEFRSDRYFQELGLGSRISAVHDVPLQYGATFGAVGLVAWLAVMLLTLTLLIRGLLRGVQNTWLAVSVAGAWVAYLAQSLISIDGPALKGLGWLMTGLVIAVAAPRSRPVSRARWAPWLAALLGLAAAGTWLLAISSTTAAMNRSTVQEAAGDVANPLVPCPARQASLFKIAESAPLDYVVPLLGPALDVDPLCPAWDNSWVRSPSKAATLYSHDVGRKQPWNLSLEMRAPGSFLQGLRCRLETWGRPLSRWRRPTRETRTP